MTKYNKAIAAIVGNIVAILLVYFGSKGLAQCTVATADVDSVCTVFGFSSSQITGGVMFVVNTAFVFLSPKNANT